MLTGISPNVKIDVQTTSGAGYYAFFDTGDKIWFTPVLFVTESANDGEQHYLEVYPIIFEKDQWMTLTGCRDFKSIVSEAEAADIRAKDPRWLHDGLSGTTATEAVPGSIEYPMTYEQLEEMHKIRVDGVYAERNALVCALSKIFPSCIIHDNGDEIDPAWMYVVLVNLPTGQATWHVHSDLIDTMFSHLEFDPNAKWDGHSNAEKYDRVAALPTGIIAGKVGNVVAATMEHFGGGSAQ